MTEIMQMLNIMNTIIAYLPNHNKRSDRASTRKSKLINYRHFASLLDIMFHDTTYEIDG
jgi:hypothetical protein